MTAPHRESNSGRQAVDGVLLLDKPAGITSQAAVSGVKRLFSAVKAGHTGTLDPMASGLLPICLGEATKFSHMLLEADKTYTATVLLGLTAIDGTATLAEARQASEQLRQTAKNTLENVARPRLDCTAE